MSKRILNLAVNLDIFKMDGTIIPNQDAIRMIQGFRLDFGSLKDVSYSVNFEKDDLDEIKKLLDSIPGVNGFALCYAKYPADGSLNPPGQKYERRQTIVLVPTINGKPIPQLDLDKPLKGPFNDGSAFDHGQLEP